jgi:hypothetical protein
MSAADGFMSPRLGAAHAELERRYRRLLRLYPREFRVRHTEEMLGVLMETAADGQSRPARGDVSDIVRGSLLARLRGPRGGWTFALAAFALVAPLFLVLTDALQVAFPYWESQAVLRSRISFVEAHPLPMSAPDIPQYLLVRQHDGGLQLLGQPAFLILVAGHAIVAAAVLAGLRRTALAALVIAAAVDCTQWNSDVLLHPGSGTMACLTVAVFPLVAIALAVADPRTARRAEHWRYVIPVLALAAATQLWILAFDATRVGNYLFVNRVDLPAGNAILAIGLALTVLGVLLPLALGLGWRTSLLLAAACYPLVLLATTITDPGHSPLTRLTRVVRPVPPAVAHLETLAFLYLPLLLVLCWAAVRIIRPTRARNSRDLAV